MVATVQQRQAGQKLKYTVFQIEKVKRMRLRRMMTQVDYA